MSAIDCKSEDKGVGTHLITGTQCRPEQWMLNDFQEVYIELE